MRPTANANLSLFCDSGSGSSYAYGVLDTGYKADMTYEEAFDLAQRAIYAASLRDFGTGGAVTGE